MDLEKTVKNLKLRHHQVQVFKNREEAIEYLCSVIRDTEVGIGGSQTVEELGLFDRLSEHNTVHWHWRSQDPDVREKENASPVFITGINALSEDGEILNIDGSGNRLAGLVYGKKKVYYIAGTNKICPDFDSALYRARNVAAPRNAMRFPYKTPCKIDGKCHDCRSPERICNALTVVWAPMFGMETEVILIDEELGF